MRRTNNEKLESLYVMNKRMCVVLWVARLTTSHASFTQCLGINPHVGRKFMSHSICLSKGSKSNQQNDELDPLPSAPYSSERALDSAIDSFLRGEYDRPYAEDAMAPHPFLTPGTTVEAALRSLRKLDDPEPSHGAAVFLRFCAPLSRGERWGGGTTVEAALRSLRKLDDPEPSHGAAVFLRFCAPLSRGERWGGGTTMDPWKNVLRGGLTPTMLARRLRASDFSVLLDWNKLDVTDGYSLKKDLIGLPTVAFVNAALYFGETEPGVGIGGGSVVIVQFRLRRIGGVWLIESASRSKRELFVESDA
jgi:hypothetical protein